MSTELALLGADTANQQAGGNSFFDRAAMFTGSAALSGIASIYNTFVDYGNMLGANATELDTSRVLESYDSNWYQYYKDNKQLADVTGFIVGSLIPGTLGIKGLQALQAGRAAGAIGRAVSGPLSIGLVKREAALSAGLAELGASGNSAYAYLNANKWAAIGWNSADQVLQGAAFEVAVLLTMKNSPVLADSTKKDILGDMAMGMFFGGAVGGLIGSFAITSTFKDAVKGIGAASRKYDVLPTHGGQGLAVGDEAWGVVRSWLDLPTSVEVADKTLTLANRLGKGTRTVDLEGALGHALTTTQRSAIEELQLTMQRISSKETPEVGEAFSGHVLRMLEDGKKAGMDNAALKQQAGDFLQGLKSGKILPEGAKDFNTQNVDELFYLADDVDLAGLRAGAGIPEFLEAARSRNPFEKNATAKPYKLVGDIANLKLTSSAHLFQEAWEQGFDMAIIGGKLRINPSSSVFSQVRDPILTPARYFNSRTGGISDEVVGTWADHLPAGAKAEKSILEDGVLTNGKTVLKVADEIATVDPIVATARHAWANSLDAAHFAGRVVDAGDISRLERLKELGLSPEELQKLGVKVGFGELPQLKSTAKGEQAAGSFTAKDGKTYNYRITVQDAGEIRISVNGKVPWSALDEQVASLQYSSKLNAKGAAQNPVVVVDDAFQRLGLATQMYNLAHKNYGLIPERAAKGTDRTPMGAAFRNSYQPPGGNYYTENVAGVNLAELLVDAKLARTQELLDLGITDHRVITYITNTTDEWYLRALQNGWQRTGPEDLAGASRKLGEYLKRENFVATWDSPRSLIPFFNQPRPPALGNIQLKDGTTVLVEAVAAPGAFSNLARQQYGEPVAIIAKNGQGEEVGRLTYMPGGGPIDSFVREQDRRKGIANALYDAHREAGGKLPDDTFILSAEASALRESRKGQKMTYAEEIAAAEKAANSKGATYVDTFVTGEIGFNGRVALSEQARIDASTIVLGPKASNQLVDINDATALVRTADELGVGAGLATSSNANYGDRLRLWAQTTGKILHNAIVERVSRVLEQLQPHIGELKANRLAGAELGAITTMLRCTSEPMYLVEDAGSATTHLVPRSVTKDGAIDQIKLDAWIAANPGKQATFEIENAEVIAFLNTWRGQNAARISDRSIIMNSRGLTVGWDPQAIYAPPIDTKKYPYFAYVKLREGTLGGSSDVGMITAKSAADLQKQVNGIRTDLPGLEVYYKEQTERYFKVKNEYDSQLALNEPRVNSEMRKTGKLSDYFYEVRAENVLEDYINYTQRAETAIVRQAGETRYAQVITELRSLGAQYDLAATSKTSALSRFQDVTAVNPFEDYVRTALDISKRSSFPLIEQMNELVDSAGTRAYSILFDNTQKARAGLISWQEAEKIATRYGIGGVYNESNIASAYNVANRPMDRNLIRETVSKANMMIATLGLRFDAANALVNVISMPIMLGTELASLKTLAKTDPKAVGALAELLTVGVNGTPVPSYTKVIGRAISNILGKDGKQLIESYRTSGDIRDVLAQFHEMLGELAINPRVLPSEWSKTVSKWTETTAKWIGNTFAEDFTRAISANVMDQLTAPLVAAGKLSTKEAGAYRSVFVNRVNGNYIASQRPILFQGTIGAGVSLFQTYMFNVMQQLGRHIENRDARALFTMGGLQAGLYGFNGIPFFDAVNTHIIGNANINDGHRDIYSTTTQLAGKEAGDWLMYGTASKLPFVGDQRVALYSRGDLNPRHVTILPVSPLDIPAVDVTRRFAANIADVGKKLVSGADISSALLEGLEHNGVNRPLAGLAQLAQGYTSTSKGSLISASNEFSLTVAATRILGAKPMDEAIALNTMFRQNAYKAADLQRLSSLGEVVKTKLRGNQMPAPDEMNEFMKQYASAGGNLQQYAGALQRWSKDANMSVVEQMKRHHASPYAQRLTEIMGDTTIQDFVNVQQKLADPTASQP